MAAGLEKKTNMQGYIQRCASGTQEQEQEQTCTCAISTHIQVWEKNPQKHPHGLVSVELETTMVIAMICNCKYFEFKLLQSSAHNVGMNRFSTEGVRLC